MTEERDLLLLCLFKYRQDIQQRPNPRNDDLMHIFQCLNVIGYVICYIRCNLVYANMTMNIPFQLIEAESISNSGTIYTKFSTRECIKQLEDSTIKVCVLVPKILMI